MAYSIAKRLENYGFTKTSQGRYLKKAAKYKVYVDETGAERFFITAIANNGFVLMQAWPISSKTLGQVINAAIAEADNETGK